MLKIGTFKTHIPPDFLEGNRNVDEFSTVLDGMRERKEEQVSKYTDSFDPRLAMDIETLRKYVDEFGGEYRLDTPHRCLECLYMHKWDIYGRKGTDVGFKQWLLCITGAEDITYNYQAPYPFIHFNGFTTGILPNGEDLSNELTPAPGVQPFRIPTLLDDTWSWGYTTIDITIVNPYSTSQEFQDWLMALVPLYLPTTDAPSCIINFIIQ